MKTLSKLAFASAGFAATAASLSATTLTTTFVGGNGFAGSMFDVEVFGNSLTVNSLDIHLERLGNSSGSATASLYTKVGSYQGSEMTAGDWTLAGTSSIFNAGLGNASSFEVPDFSLSANTVYGFYVDLVSYDPVGDRLVYSNSNQAYSNGDLQINSGIGRGDGAFTGSVFSTRTWNGSINYNLNSENGNNGGNGNPTSPSSKVPDASSTFGLLSIALVGMASLRRKLR